MNLPMTSRALLWADLGWLGFQGLLTLAVVAGTTYGLPLVSWVMVHSFVGSLIGYSFAIVVRRAVQRMQTQASTSPPPAKPDLRAIAGGLDPETGWQKFDRALGLKATEGTPIHHFCTPVALPKASVRVLHRGNPMRLEALRPQHCHFEGRCRACGSEDVAFEMVEDS